MTDKERMNDSLKNSGKNFNENFTHKKEQIINKEIDVSKCEWFKDGMCYAECDLEGYTDWECKDTELSNCYYKQLARKTQECESLKEEIEVLKDNFDTATRDCNELIAELKQECEELRKENQELRNSLSDSLMFRFTSQDKEADRYRKALEEIEKIVKINCEEICGRKFEDCNDTSCFSAELLDIINKAKGEKKCQ